MTALTQLDATGSHPYGDHAMRYLYAGWSPLPLPARAKKHPPEGWTGARGAWPSGADVHAWTEDRPDGNIALRLPPNVIGVDVDNYDGKIGGLVLADLETTLGALPATWRSTSRDDGVSGIRFYTAPEGLRWPGELGPGVEVIRHGHRYAVAWPSIHPDTGGTYKWINPAGNVTIGEIPTPEALPALPPAWVERFTGGEMATDQARAGLDAGAANAWLTARSSPAACRVTERALGALLDALTRAGAGSRHEAALTGTNRLLWIAGLGHTGVPAALATARSAFLAATGTDRAPGEAEAEWGRLIDGGIQLAAAAHPDIPGVDPCLDPFHGLLPTTPTASTPAPTASGNGSSTSSTSTTPPSTSPDGSPTSPPDASAAGSDLEQTSLPDETERTSWWPVDLDDYLDGDAIEPELPLHLARDDGHAAFYPGRINGIIGPSESGKTWVALHCVAQAIRAGQRVTILDFEDSARGTTGRLLTLGLDRHQIREHVRYINPDAPFHPYLPTGLDLGEHLDTWQPDLVILDGFNAAMTLQSLELKDNTDVTSFFQNVLRNLARNDATVVYIDHTPKDKDNASNGGIGAQAKRAMTTGCTLKADPVRPFGKGQNGRIRLYVDKDRIGEVRGSSPTTKTGHWFADLVVTSRDDGSLDLELVVPEGFNSETGHREAHRPTVLMGRVSEYLQANPGAGQNEIVNDVRGNDRSIRAGLAILVEEGWVGVEKQGQKKLHTLLKAYSEDVDPAKNQLGANWGPTGGQAPGYETGGHRGPTGGDVVSRSPAPSCTPNRPPENPDRGPRPNIVERVIAGERVKFNLDTGEIVDTDDSEAGTP